MNIESAKYNEGDSSVNVVINGKSHSVPVDERNRHYQMLLEWQAEGVLNVIEPADPPPAPLTKAEVIDNTGEVFIAFLKAYAKREGLTMAQIKNAIENEMV